MFISFSNSIAGYLKKAYGLKPDTKNFYIFIEQYEQESFLVT